MNTDKSKTEIARLRRELKQVKKENKSLSIKLETANSQKMKLRDELKKKDVQRIELSKEQQESLSNRLKDTDILNSLFD